VSLALPRAGGAALELIDVGGRRLERRELAALGPGRHEVTMGQGPRLAPGVYWRRLTQGVEARSARVAVVR
jgi:hypothetical protein